MNNETELNLLSTTELVDLNRQHFAEIGKTRDSLGRNYSERGEKILGELTIRRMMLKTVRIYIEGLGIRYE